MGSRWSQYHDPAKFLEDLNSIITDYKNYVLFEKKERIHLALKKDFIGSNYSGTSSELVSLFTEPFEARVCSLQTWYSPAKIKMIRIGGTIQTKIKKWDDVNLNALFNIEEIIDSINYPSLEDYSDIIN
jgi:hypothetical protein